MPLTPQQQKQIQEASERLAAGLQAFLDLVDAAQRLRAIPLVLTVVLNRFENSTADTFEEFIEELALHETEDLLKATTE